MFHLEKMEVHHFPFAVQLANTMNWNMTPSDFEFMKKLEPEGCFVLFYDLNPLGIATSISFGEVGWLGNLVIKENFRREGAGKIMINHIISYLKNKGAKTIGLYAYKHLVDFYKSFGFEPDIDFTVLRGKVKAFSPQIRLKEATNNDFSEIIDFDKQCFRGNRQKLLEAILFDLRNMCYFSSENSKITGYITAKLHSKNAEIGPLICNLNREKEAVFLLENILSRLNGVEVFIYLPKKEAELINMLYTAGLREDFPVVRMILGSAIPYNCIYAAESLERG